MLKGLRDLLVKLLSYQDTFKKYFFPTKKSLFIPPKKRVSFKNAIILHVPISLNSQKNHFISITENLTIDSKGCKEDENGAYLSSS
jgi:hypothetical protein